MKVMKKILKNSILTFVLGAIIFSGITAYAAGRYYANQVEYEPSNPNFNVDNMADALDELYDKTKNYKNLSTPTDVESNYLLNGKKAYKSNGTLVTGSIPTYSGTTNITASSETQTLQTNGKYMNSDITINALSTGCGNGISSSYNKPANSQININFGFVPKLFVVSYRNPLNNSIYTYEYNQLTNILYMYELKENGDLRFQKSTSVRFEDTTLFSVFSTDSGTGVYNANITVYYTVWR